MPSLHELRKKLREGLPLLPEEAPKENPPEEDQPSDYAEIPWWSYTITRDIGAAYRFFVPRGSLTHTALIAEEAIGLFSNAELIREILTNMELWGIDACEPGTEIRVRVEKTILEAKKHWKENNANPT